MFKAPWYTATEHEFLKQGKWVIGSGLAIVAGVSIYFFVEVVIYEKKAIPAAAWLTYMLMP